ncbi:hypothetical protein E2C01_093093 [Portunus trituberculatus]|uniref:Uncharacterized protein n=1 Tax=Portunus trituberculatus TaxID=210409 RepID=A0A5B7JNW7_PORTR|nr:hypothetical protein [Portunus trituberculatus]
MTAATGPDLPALVGVKAGGGGGGRGGGVACQPSLLAPPFIPPPHVVLHTLPALLVTEPSTRQAGKQAGTLRF